MQRFRNRTTDSTLCVWGVKTVNSTIIFHELHTSMVWHPNSRTKRSTLFFCSNSIFYQLFLHRVISFWSWARTSLAPWNCRLMNTFAAWANWKFNRCLYENMKYFLSINSCSECHLNAIKIKYTVCVHNGVNSHIQFKSAQKTQKEGIKLSIESKKVANFFK